MVVKSSRKAVSVVESEITKLALELSRVPLLKKLVGDELDRRCQAIEDIVASGYGQHIGMRAEDNQAAVKAAVLELVRSPLADLERQLAALPVEPEPEPVEAVKPEELPAAAEEQKPEGKPAKAKA